MDRNRKRAAAGICVAAVIVAGVASAPAAEADTTTGTTTTSSSGGLLGGLGDVLNGVGSGLGTIVGGVTTGLGDIIGGGTSSTPTVSASPSASAPLSGVTSGVGDVLSGVAGGAQQIVDGVVGTGTVTLPTTVPTSLPTTAPTDLPTSLPTATASVPTTDGGTSATPAVVTSVTVTPSIATVYPAVDGYRDSVVFSVRGATTDGAVHPVTGTASLTFGSTTVATWPITSTNQDITWNGWVGSVIKPGGYVLTATVSDGSGSSWTGIGKVAVSAQRLMAASTTVASKAVSGTHALAAKAKAGLARGAVQLRLRTVAHGVKGKQYLVLTHGAEKVRIRVLNGTHTSKAVTIPSSFTTYRVSHTWKHGVTLTSAKYVYSFKQLK